MNKSEQDMIDMIKQNEIVPQIDEGHRDTLRDRALQAFDKQADADTQTHFKPLFRFKGTTVMKFAASITLFAAVGIFAFMALTPAKAIAFEDVAREILKIESASFEITSTVRHADGTTEEKGTHKCVTKMPNLLRTEEPDGDTILIDFAKNKVLLIGEKKQVAVVMEDFAQFSEDDSLQKNLFGEVQKHLRNAEKGGDFGGIKYENLGEKKIGGTQAVGFRVLNPDAKEDGVEAQELAKGLPFNTLDIWADAKTGVPVYLVFAMDQVDGSQVKSTFTNFAYNKELDPKLFVFEVPKGYELIDANDPLRVAQVFGFESKFEELNELANKLADEMDKNIESILKDLGNERPSIDHVIDALRAYSRQTSGKLPDTLESEPMMDAMMSAWEKDNPGKELFNDDASFTDEKLNQNMALIVQASAYLQFLEQSGGQYTYRGKGVKTDAEPTPVLWLQSKGGSSYTVIYNDFSVRDTNTGPDDQ